MPQNPLLSKALLWLALTGATASVGNAKLSNTRAGLEREFGKSFRIEDTRHWLLVTDLGSKRTAEIGRLLERSHDRFYKEWSKLGAEPLEHRLVCIAFATRAGLDRYRARMGRETPGGAGFYSSDTNRVVLCDEEHESRGGGRTTSFGAGGAKRHNRTAHEAVHQLAFNSELHVRGRACPAWFAEGLASNYEPATASSSFGLKADFPRDRLHALKSLRAADKLLDLEQLVAIRPGSESHRHRAALYPQAAALCRFLYARSPEGFTKYREQLARIRIQYPSQSSLRHAFEASFGSIETMRPAWEKFLEDPDKSPERVSLAGVPKRRGAVTPRSR